MQPEPFKFLKNMLETPSPSGFEQPVQRIVRKRMAAHADTIETDVHGNVIAALNPKGSPRVMLAGHCDQIGFMIMHITDQGFLHVGQIGGIDAAVVPGLQLTIYGPKGPVDGVIGRKPVHLIKPEDRGNGKIELHALWVDIGAKDRKDAQKRVQVGNPVTFKLGMIELNGDIVSSPGMDNKTGTWVVMEALRLAAKKRIKCALYAVSTVQEELGLRGARTAGYGVDPLVGIAVDVTHASDCPDIDKRIAGEVALGKGPTIEIGANINPKVSDLLLSTAKDKRIPYQRAGSPMATGTDANALQITRAGVAAGLVSIPNRYMHTPIEVVHLGDLEAAAKLLAETIARIDARTKFIPS
jgi:endoglucanase